MPNSGSPQQNTPAQRVLAVIPARLASQRLPRKMLRTIAGKPLVGWTYEAVSACPQFSQVIIAVDAQETASVCEANGWKYRMTPSSLPSGTDRLYAVSMEVDADLYVNIQGDEPLIRSEHVEALLRPFRNPMVEVTTLSVDCAADEVHNPNAVKVVTAPDGRALFFSRSAIPYDRDGVGLTLRKHLGLYAYRRAALSRFAALPTGYLEQVEKLEQLRLLENGMALYVTHVSQATIGVDTEGDLRAVEALLQSNDPPRAAAQVPATG